jgi:hypothetical protein
MLQSRQAFIKVAAFTALIAITGILTPQSAQAARWWRPTPGTTFQWQLAGPIDTTVDADVYDVDLFETRAATVSALKAQGRRTICYISVGSYENYRPDSRKFPRSVLGERYDGYPDERWLDIRRIDILGPIMEARFDLCKKKGFDAIEPDNIDGYTNRTGFPLTATDQLRYNRWLARAAHARGLSIGLKNDNDQAAALEPYFDWALTEDCQDQSWCGDMRIFTRNNKAVFMTEYTDTGATLTEFCPVARRLGFTGILKHRSLDAWVRKCP